MKALTRFALAAGAVVGLSAVALPAVAGADTAPPLPAFAQGGGHALFVQTDNTAGNQIVAYIRNANGTLAPAGTYATGGLGGVLNGSAVDHLASQGSLTYDAVHNLLYAVNAGSNTVSVFSVHGAQLSLRLVINSGGQFPVSVAGNGNNVYVLTPLAPTCRGMSHSSGASSRSPIRIAAWGSRYPATRTNSRTHLVRWPFRRTGPS